MVVLFLHFLVPVTRSLKTLNSKAGCLNNANKVELWMEFKQFNQRFRYNLSFAEWLAWIPAVFLRRSLQCLCRKKKNFWSEGWASLSRKIISFETFLSHKGASSWMGNAILKLLTKLYCLGRFFRLLTNHLPDKIWLINLP